jgi:hypothetical protein
VDVDKLVEKVHLQIARLTWGMEGQEALNTISICLDGIIREAVAEVTGKPQMMKSIWPKNVGEDIIPLWDEDAD